MTQNDLNRAVASAIGETVSTVARRGFSLVDPTELHRCHRLGIAGADGGGGCGSRELELLPGLLPATECGEQVAESQVKIGSHGRVRSDRFSQCRFSSWITRLCKEEGEAGGKL